MKTIKLLEGNVSALLNITMYNPEITQEGLKCFIIWKYIESSEIHNWG